MSVQPSVDLRPIEADDDFSETRIEAVGYLFHGHAAPTEGRRAAIKPGANLLHFAKCAKLEKVDDVQTKIWFRTIAVAKSHLDKMVGEKYWKWCKICEREITQRNINER